MNLLENARRYSGGHPVKVRAGRDRAPPDGPDRRSRSRDPVQRAATDLRALLPRHGRRRASGSGLGLAIARGFVEANDGRLTAESLPGQGTTFVVELPLAASDPTPTPGRERGPATVSAAGRRVLVCDDELQIIRALKVILRDSGFEVLATATAKEALDTAAVESPDAAIIDLRAARRRRGRGLRAASILERDADPRPLGGRRGGRRRFGRSTPARTTTSPSRSAPASWSRASRRPCGAPAPRPISRCCAPTASSSTSPGTRCGVDGDEVHLTPTEFELLQTLMANRGRLMTHGALLTQVWGPAYADDVATLRTHIANLRRRSSPRAPPGTSAPRRASATGSSTELYGILMRAGGTLISPRYPEARMVACQQVPPSMALAPPTRSAAERPGSGARASAAPDI